MEIRAQMFVESVSSTTVVLEKVLNLAGQDAPAGTGIAMITVITKESTADANFWGTTGSCSAFEVIFRRQL